MIIYFTMHHRSDFHPSILRVSNTPSGRVSAPLHGLLWKLFFEEKHDFAIAANNAAILRFFSIIFFAVIWLTPTALIANHLGQFTIYFFFSGPIFAGIVTSLDHVFWVIQRMHDHGKSWLWAIVPPLGCLFLFGLCIAIPILLGDPFTIIFSAIILIFGAIPLLAYYLTLISRAGMNEPNRYGPVPEPIPQSLMD